jgi:hypothetical protein
MALDRLRCSRDVAVDPNSPRVGRLPALRSSPTVTKRKPSFSPADSMASRTSTIREGSAMPSWRMTTTPGARFLVTSHRM